MPHVWTNPSIQLENFAPSEFEHPDRMSVVFLYMIDELATRSKETFEKMFPGERLAIRITDDFRTQEDVRRIYAAEIRAGRPVPDSAHLRGCAVDMVPICAEHRVEAAQLILTHHATGLWIEGKWPGIGWEVATRHLHGDSDRTLINQGKRPALFAGVTR